jgi:transposase InsO family protein
MSGGALTKGRAVMDILDAADTVIGQVPAPIAVVSDNGPCFRGEVFAQALADDDPLLRHVRTRVKNPQNNGVVERFFGTLTYEHLYRREISDGDALSVEINGAKRCPLDTGEDRRNIHNGGNLPTP